MAGAATAHITAWRRGHRSLPAPAGANQALPVTYPTSLLGCRVWIAPGADLTQPPTSWPWADITEFVRYQSAIRATTGRRDEHSLVEAGTGDLTLDNRDGRFSRRNPASPYYPLLVKNTPILATVDPGSGQVPRMAMFVNNWPNRSDIAGVDVTMPISCSGVLRRLGQGRVVKSAARRSLGSAHSALSSGLVAYWPFEDPDGSTSVATPVAGASAGSVLAGRAQFNGDGPFGASGSVEMICGDDLIFPPYNSNAPAVSLPIPTHSAGQLTLSFWIMGLPCIETAGADNSAESLATAACWLNFSSGTIGSLDIRFTQFTGGTSAAGYGYMSMSPWTGSDVSGTGLTEINTYPEVPALADGEWHHVAITLTQSGSDVATAIWLDGVRYDTATETGQTLGAASEFKLATAGSITNGSGSTAIGTVFHMSTVSVHNSTTVSVTDLYNAGNGYIGEQAHTRIVRLCTEEGIPIHCVGAQSTPVGMQSPATLVEALREAEAADLGVLYEVSFGLGYQCRTERHNAVVALSLDFAQGQIAGPPAHEDDDQQLRNRWTIKRKGGTEATVSDDTSIASVGLYDDSAEVSLEDDDQVANAASWRVHLGTVDEERWPGLSLNFASTAGRLVIPQWLALQFGARVQVANPPDAYSPDPVDVFLEGLTETWDPINWDAEFNTSPASPYAVHEVASNVANRGRVDAATSYVYSDRNSTDTTFAVGTVGPALWRTGTVNFDINIAGERMTVTNISGASSPQTFTVVRSVNGVVKDQPGIVNGVSIKVSLWNPAVVAL